VADVAKQIKRLLDENGFTLIRQNNHYVYYSAKLGKNFVTAATPSDCRAQKKQLTNLRNVIEGREGYSGSVLLAEADAIRADKVLRQSKVAPEKHIPVKPVRNVRKAKSSVSRGTGFRYINKIITAVTDEQKQRDKQLKIERQRQQQLFLQLSESGAEFIRKYLNQHFIEPVMRHQQYVDANFTHFWEVAQERFIFRGASEAARRWSEALDAWQVLFNEEQSLGMGDHSALRLLIIAGRECCFEDVDSVRAITESKYQTVIERYNRLVKATTTYIRRAIRNQTTPVISTFVIDVVNSKYYFADVTPTDAGKELRTPYLPLFIKITNNALEAWHRSMAIVPATFYQNRGSYNFDNKAA
jgi:hypothetical protein